EILSCMLKDKDCRIEAINKLKAKCFSIDLNQRLFRTIEQMERNNKNIDLTLVLQEMDELGLRKDGDIFNVSEIYNNFSHKENLNKHIEKLLEGYRNNEFKKKMFNFIATDKVLDTDNVLNELSKIIEDRQTEDTSTITLQEWLVNEVGKRLELEKPQPLGILTGYRDLDRMLKGIVEGSLVTLLARSGI
ncbi:DnaB-like helicase N-terminal domain-containing protein, partial [Clostridium tepidiprofundi]|uniref:DnaB-like helicase N-terminal domain-containing protein n=1 Tax=Clostridium tepidiprofundi TaxID=420412 RepID=UPI000A7BDAED